MFGSKRRRLKEKKENIQGRNSVEEKKNGEGNGQMF